MPLPVSAFTSAIRGVFTLLISLLASAMPLTANAIEEPAYTVERAWESEQIEIRRYAPRVMAVTTMQGNDDDGFRVLAGYIFGGNATEQKIAMTAPVQQSMAGEAEMAFMMPAEYCNAFIKQGNDVVGKHGVAFVSENLGNHAILRSRHFKHYFFSLDIDHIFVTTNRLPHLHVPPEHGRIGHGFRQQGNL